MTELHHGVARIVPPATRPRTTLPPADAVGRSRRARTEPMAVRPLRDGRYAVETDSDTYEVDLTERTCTCPDHTIRNRRCKHLRRVAIEITLDRLPAPDERTLICAVCGTPTFRPETERESEHEPPLCDRHRPAPGDLVQDRETDKTVIVTSVTGRRADEYVVPDTDRTVAAFDSNAGYGAHEPVIEAVYLESLPALPTATEIEEKRRYAFPASRLRPIDRDRESDDLTAVDGSRSTAAQSVGRCGNFLHSRDLLSPVQ